MAKRRNANIIILVIVGFLFLLLFLILLLINEIKNNENNISNTVIVSIGNRQEEVKSVQQIIEDAGSIYISESGSVISSIYVDFKYDLFDDNGNSKKDYFYDIIDEIMEIKKKSFYLKDSEKNIEISVIYDKDKDDYSVFINNVENYYNVTDGKIYIDLSSSSKFTYSKFFLNNELIRQIGTNNSYYANTILSDQNRVDLGNGYYSYQDGSIIARLQSGKALNIIFKEKYLEEFSPGITVKTKLSDIIKKYPEPSFGSIKDGYLGYITEFAYVFFYENEVSVYMCEYKENEYFNQYILNYCNSGNLDKLVSDFTTEWTSYFENTYDSDLQNFKISFPTRGILIDIKNNDSKGIVLYNNYYLTDDIINLIKSKKITLEGDKDLLNITEQNRRESMK